MQRLCTLIQILISPLIGLEVIILLFFYCQTSSASVSSSFITVITVISSCIINIGQSKRSCSMLLVLQLVLVDCPIKGSIIIIILAKYGILYELFKLSSWDQHNNRQKMSTVMYGMPDYFSRLQCWYQSQLSLILTNTSCLKSLIIKKFHLKKLPKIVTAALKQNGINLITK